MEIDYILFANIPNDQIDSIVVPATPITAPLTDKTKKDVDEVNAKFDKDNKTVRGHILNHMTN